MAAIHLSPQVLYAQGDFEVCLQLVEHALSLNPDYQRGRALRARMTGDSDGAGARGGLYVMRAGGGGGSWLASTC
jgi:hypothetical protein